MYENQDSQKPLKTLFDSRITETVRFVGRTSLRAVLVRRLVLENMVLLLILITVRVLERAQVILTLVLAVPCTIPFVPLIRWPDLIGLVHPVMSVFFIRKDTVPGPILIIFLL